MSFSAKELRYKTKEVLNSIRRGESPLLTFRGHAIAKIIPLKVAEKKSLVPIGFGIWKKHDDMKDVSQWLDQQRKPRYDR